MRLTAPSSNLLGVIKTFSRHSVRSYTYRGLCGSQFPIPQQQEFIASITEDSNTSNHYSSLLR